MEEEKALYYAINNDDPCGISYLLREGLPVDTVYDGIHSPAAWSALHLCCEKGRVDCAKVLLDAKANPDIRGKWSQSPLMFAVTSEWTNMIELLLHYGADIEARDGCGLTPLHLSVTCEDATCLSLLCAAGADIDASDKLGRTPLWRAAAEDGHGVHMERLVTLGADVNAVDAKDKFTPLQAAIWYSDRDRRAYIKTLLEAGARISPADPNDPQHTAITTLIQRTWHLGVDLSPDDEHITHVLLHCSSTDSVDMLVPDGVYSGLHTLRHTRRGTALHMAAHRGAPTMVGLLLEAGADPNIQDVDGRTALHAAVIYNHLSCIQLLLTATCRLDLRADIYIDNLHTTKHNITAFECALHCGHLHAARLMVEAGYDLRYEHYLWSKSKVLRLSQGNVNMSQILPDRADVEILYNKKVPLTLIENPGFLQQLIDFVTKWQDLRSLCRRTIRNNLRYNQLCLIDTLPLPAVLKEYVSLTGNSNVH